MSVFASIVALVGALAWPVVVLVVVLMFKDQLVAALGRLTKVDLPGGLSAQLASTALLAGEDGTPQALTSGGESADFAPARRLATVEPGRAIETAWQMLVETQNRVRGTTYSPLRRSADAMVGYAEEGRIAGKYAAVADSLFEWFRRAHMTPDAVNATDALVFIQAAEDVALAIIRSEPSASQPPG